MTSLPKPNAGSCGGKGCSTSSIKTLSSIAIAPLFRIFHACSPPDTMSLPSSFRRGRERLCSSSRCFINKMNCLDCNISPRKTRYKASGPTMPPRRLPTLSSSAVTKNCQISPERRSMGTEAIATKMHVIMPTKPTLIHIPDLSFLLLSSFDGLKRAVRLLSTTFPPSHPSPQHHLNRHPGALRNRARIRQTRSPPKAPSPPSGLDPATC